MTIIFTGTEDISFSSLSGGAAVETNSSNFDANYSRNAISIDTSGSVARVKFDSSSDHIYISYRLRHANATSSTNDFRAMSLYDGNTEVFRVLPVDGIWNLYTFDGGAQLRDTLSPNLASGIFKWTIRFHLHTSGGFDVWIDDQLRASFSGDTIGDTGATAVDEADWSGSRSSNTSQAVSEIIVATSPQQTINMRLATLVPNGDGNQVDWTNGFANVDEVTHSIEDTIDSDTANDVELMDVGAYGGNVDYAVQLINVKANALKGATGPQNFQFAARHNVTDGFSGNKSIAEIYSVFTHDFSLNPDTGVAWTIADLAAAQFGVKSIT